MYTEKLIEKGIAARPYLLVALKSEQIETRTRARDALRAIHKGTAFQLPESGLRLSKEGRKQAIFQKRTEKYWKNPPKVRWWVENAGLKNNSTTLVESEGKNPIVVVTECEKGRVAYMGTDDWWLWRKGYGNQSYYPAYQNILRWLAKKLTPPLLRSHNQTRIRWLRFQH